jgi:tripartite-type tricarboxylate transporter receptor subunit TctC
MHLRRALRTLTLAAIALAPAFPVAHARSPGARGRSSSSPRCPPGSGLDITLRLLADKLHAEHGGTAIVENRPGADGIVAAQHTSPRRRPTAPRCSPAAPRR